MKTAFALALFAGAAAAYKPQQQQFYSPYQQHHHNQQQQQQQQPSAPTNPWEPKAPPAQHQQHGGYYTNPWQTQYHQKPQGWYSSYQQYKPATIPFVASPSIVKPTYAKCRFAGNMGANELQFGQVPGYAAAVKAEFMAMRAPVGAVAKFTVLEFGKDDSMTCANGDEFNPLEEKYHGIVVPHQDPARGRIDDVVIGENGEGILDQKKFLQNLRGKNGIIGKAIKGEVFVDGSSVISGCCIIREDMPPMAAAPSDDASDDASDKTHSHHGGHYNPYQSQYNHQQQFRPSYRPSYRPQQYNQNSW